MGVFQFWKRDDMPHVCMLSRKKIIKTQFLLPPGLNSQLFHFGSKGVGVDLKEFCRHPDPGLFHLLSSLPIEYGKIWLHQVLMIP